MSETILENYSSSNSYNHVISWSGGKDSTATIILFHEHERELLRPGDKVTILFAEVMFDKEHNISGHNPDIIKFIYDKKEIFESWGYNVEILRSDKDYLDVFYHKLKRSPDPARVGLTHGFVPSGICAVKRDCKLKPINQWYKDHPGNIYQYIGIAIDESKRLDSLHKMDNTFSLLERYNFTEDDAMKLCEKYDMVSPQYFMEGLKRDGCWFCPNSKYVEKLAIAKAYPDAWNRYVLMEAEPNLAYPKWNVFSKETLHDIDAKIQKELGTKKEECIEDVFDNILEDMQRFNSSLVSREVCQSFDDILKDMQTSASKLAS